MADKIRNWRRAVIGLAAAAPLILASAVPAIATPTVVTGKARPAAAGAQFTVPRGKLFAGQAALFNAAASRSAGPVAAFSWTLSGPGVVFRSYGAACSTNTSEMQTSFGRSGVMHVTLKVSYTSGAVSSVTHSVRVTAARVHPIAATMARRATQWLLCQRGPTDPAVQPVSNGGPPSGCQDEYFDGPIDAIGCFSVLPSYGKIPAPERKILCPYFPTKCASSKTPVVPELLPVVSTRTVRLNGVDFTPATAFVLDQNDGWMGSSNTTASFLSGQLPISTGRLLKAEYSQPLFSVSLSQLIARYPGLAQLLNLSGLQVSGEMTVALAQAVSTIKASVTLPASFTGSGGSPVTSSAMFTATNQSGLVLDDMLIAVPSADFGGAVEFDDLAFCYQQHIRKKFCEKKTGVNFGAYEGTSASSWNATAKINILGTQIDAVPSPVNPDQGIGFVNGQFDFAGADVSFDPALPLGDSGLSLSSLEASLALNPTRFTGAIGLTAGDLVSINGQLFMVFASPSQPYTFTANQCKGSPSKTVTAFALMVCGNVGIVLPIVGNTHLASGYILYAYPGYLAAGGTVGFNVSTPIASLGVNGGVNGQFSLDNTTFNVEGNVSVNASALGLTLSMGASAVVSSIGVGACGTITLPWPIGTVSAGVGYTWGGAINAWVGSCDLSPYIVVVSGGPGNAAVTGPVHVSIPAGLPTEMIQVRGSGGDLTITGPGGTHASIGTGRRAFAKSVAIFRDGHTTYIAIIKPRAGVYTITPDHGSRITEVLAAQGRNGSVLRQYTVHVPRAS